jgi:type IV secretion system protein VirB8
MRDTTTVPANAIQDHFSAALSWEVNLESVRAKSERRAWIVAAAASVLALVAVIGLATLAPFRRNVPYLFAVEKTTGNVEFVGAIDDRRILGYQELLDKHWAQRYIVARESYFYRLLQNDYDTVLALSEDSVGRDFSKLYDGPDARDARFGANVEMKVVVLSVQLAQNAVGSQAVIRFAKTSRRIDSEHSEPPQYFVATLSYEYKPSMSGKEKDLLANPLGYRVTSYRVDSELAPVAAPTARPAAS